LKFDWIDEEYEDMLFEEDEPDEVVLSKSGEGDRGHEKRTTKKKTRGKTSIDKVLARLEDALSGLSEGDLGLVIKKLKQAKRVTRCGTCKDDLERTVIDADYVSKVCRIGGEDCDEGMDSLSERIEGLYHEYGDLEDGGVEDNGRVDDMDKKEIEELDKKVHRKIMFTSQNCGGCKDVKEQFENLDVDMDSIEEIDVEDDDGSELADRFGIRRVPGFVLLDKHGKVLESDFDNVIDYLVGID